MKKQSLKIIWLLTILLGIGVVTLGAYTRLTHAGLGCPDWPACYGTWSMPTPETQDALQARYPDAPLEAPKAKTEMEHRYLAGTFGLFVFGLAIAVHLIPSLHHLRHWGKVIVLFVLAQAALGRYTVTLKLSPVIVMLHLCLGLSTVALLLWGYLQRTPQQHRSSPFSKLLLIIIGCQILLGGWTSANYAATVCNAFPTCLNTGTFVWDFTDAFWKGLSLAPGLAPHSLEGLATIHMVHRLGAILVGIAILLWCGKHFRTAPKKALILLGLFSLQISLGIANVLLGLPLTIAVLHHVGAVLLLLFALYLLVPAKAGIPS